MVKIAICCAEFVRYRSCTTPALQKRNSSSNLLLTPLAPHRLFGHKTASN